jgi:hypothetical protein
VLTEEELENQHEQREQQRQVDTREHREVHRTSSSWFPPANPVRSATASGSVKHIITGLNDLQQKLQQNDTGKLWNDSGRLVNGY